VKDPATGLVDMGIRDYDPSLARFNEPDPKKPSKHPFDLQPMYYTADAPLGG